MENSNIKNENMLECYICFDKPTNPVATSCGHIFCWKCLQAWTSGKSKLECPVCKNGLDMNRVIPLYTSSNSNSSNKERDDRPKVERIPGAVNQDSTFYRNLLRGLGYYGAEAQVQQPIHLPTANEVKINQMAVLVFIFGFFLMMSIFYLD